MRRLRWIRWIVGAGLLAWTAWALVRETLRSGSRGHRFSADAETGDLYGVRIVPLTRAEADAALRRELLELARPWPESTPARTPPTLSH